jgi:hypothetical protein
MSTWAWLLLVYVAYIVGVGVGKHEKQIEKWLDRMER